MISSRYLQDLYAQPISLVRSAQALDRQWDAITAAGQRLAQSNHIYIVGIGSSYNAALAMVKYLADHGRCAMAVDASELAHAPALPEHVGFVVVSRSGASIEIVQVADRLRGAGIPFVAITNTPDSPLAAAAAIVINLDTDFDHLISLRMYTALVQALLALGLAICEAAQRLPVGSLAQLWETCGRRIDDWRAVLEASDYFGPGNTYYMLGRGYGLAAAHESRLLMEECGKTGATVMTTGSFRHGPQEILASPARIVIWAPQTEPARQHDLALAESIATLGGRVLLIGQNLPSATPGNLSVDLPAAATMWQPLIDIIPMQLGAHTHALRNGKSPDELVYCPYVVTSEGAL